MKVKTTTIRNKSRITRSHFRLTLSMITPAKNDKNKPGTVAVAKIFPKINSELVFSRTSQLIDMRLKPKPIREIIFPKKNNKKVRFFRSFNIIIKKV